MRVPILFSNTTASSHDDLYFPFILATTASAMALKKTSISAGLFPGSSNNAGGGAAAAATHTETADVDSASDDVAGDASQPMSGQTTLARNTPSHTPRAAGSMDSTYQGAGDKDDRIILVQFDEGDKENPMNWSKPKKWLMTSLLCSMTLAIG